MNHIAGIIGGSATTEQREARLREVLAGYGDNPVIFHSDIGLSLGYVGEPYLYGIAEQEGYIGIFYGSAYSNKDNEVSVHIDDAEAAAALLAGRLAVDTTNPSAGLYGSYIGVTAEPGNGRCLVFGDPSGNRNPFVAKQDDELLFASHPLTCAQLTGSLVVDRHYEDFFLIYGFYPDGRTVFDGVFQLGPQQSAVWSSEFGVNLAVPLQGRLPSSYNHGETTSDGLVERLYTLLLGCLDDQLGRDEQVGVLLGGFDSALIAVLLQQIGKQVTTYSFRYTDDAYNQPHTDTLQEYLGNRHIWVDIDPRMIATEMLYYAERYVQPTNWMNYVVQTAQVSARMRADGIRHAYSGDGCDALFLGFPGTYQRTRIFARLPELPGCAVDLLLGFAARQSLERWFGHPFRMALNIIRAMQREMPARAFLTFRIFDELSLRQMRGQEHPEQIESIERIISRLSKPHAGASLQRIGYISKALVSPSKIKQLGATDLHGVTMHSPYMHPEIKAFLSTIPDELLRHVTQYSLNDPGKGLLIAAARRFKLLPEAIITQPKFSAVDSPVDHWYGHELRPVAESLLANLPFTPPDDYLESLFHEKRAEQLYKKYLGSTRVTSDCLSLLVTYAAFCKAVTDEVIA